MLALIDCNNFFVSCERIFRPDLEGRPTIVLSSNDGCAIARSNEAKRLGIPMGAPVFKYRQLLQQHNVMQFSANFELYGDISQRIVHLLTEITPHIEAYSIDECFLDLTELKITNYRAWGSEVRSRLWREIGVPVAIGIAPTKTLAKLASERAKKEEDYAGVLAWPELSEADQVACLERTPVGDVWGIGRRLAPKLRVEGFSNAYQLSRMRPQYAQKMVSIQGRQLVAELNGITCLPLVTATPPQQSIMRGRTFGEDTSQLHVLEAAIASLTARATRRLRRDRQLTGRAGLYLQTNRHKPGYRDWFIPVTFPVATSDTGQIAASLLKATRGIFSPTLQYHRANVFLLDLVTDYNRQADLFEQHIEIQDRSMARMRVIDALNLKYGPRQLYFAAEDLANSWQPKHNLRSPRYTTHWDELPTASIPY